ncbi:DEAD/DEAH box helicase domain protein [Methanocaldococcus vulcanius M7]|uniref:ATP-dependent DNA helicase Hel308 n=1 Tax=Methanocaldococcus vulcanius (strain ATCC 700851 / DSM 12094 / M7) TaxID=579137 RepID=C9RHH1_METVM|nr:DEAD/DEAH box helicase [Methanocaldococcus vulcanius]ACX73023.1 DEAD/DEAH box helicase domain protein [Methanocaldococcus vulcanius M7]
MDKITKVLNDFGISELRPPQKKALEMGLLDKNKNFIISIPTASGKTLIGEIALINHLLDDNLTPTGRKGIFIVPLKALASEKYEEFKNKYEKFGLRIALSIGDYDEEEDLSKYDLIITTAEKLDSLWRHKISWIDDVSVVIVDEIHLINDETRGGTLEILLTKLKEYNIQIIGLSATIGNPDELAEWLNAELVVDDWRPIELKKGVYRNGVIEYINGSVKEIKVVNSDVYSLVVDCIKDGGSCLVFCNTKRGAVNEAKNLNLTKFLSEEERSKLKEVAEEVLSILEPPTEMCKTLAECILQGSAFHHAGLTYQHRKIVEDAFRKRLIKVICCTPTLCLNAKTEILQENGYRKITELNKNEKIFALCGGKIKPIGRWKIHKTPQHDYNITIKTENGLEITTTPNHIFLVKNGKSIKEKEAKDLKIGDLVATVGKIIVDEDINTSNFVKFPIRRLSQFIAETFNSKGVINNSIEIYSTSELFIKRLQVALLRFGIHSQIEIKNSDKKDDKTYLLKISDLEGLKLFYKNFPIDLKEKEKLFYLIKKKINNKPYEDNLEHIDFDNSFNNIAICWKKILEIKKVKVEDEYVYDIELPNDGSNDHYFVANGFVVHNSAGLNLPCRRAIIKDLMRFTKTGMRYIPIMEIQQCIGRAGRPGLDPYGEGIVIAKNDRDYLRAYQTLTQKPEPIYSKLSNYAVLRTQLLGLISTGEIKDEYDLEWFVRNTFYAHQYGNLKKVAKNIMEIIQFLEENEFIVGFTATELGKRISELYIDPLSAKYIIDGLNEMEVEHDLYYLYLISRTLEMTPNLRVYRSEEMSLMDEMESLKIKNFNIEDLEAFKTAKMLYDWINEVPEDKILEKYKIEPGILRYKVENARWMMHSLKEIAKLLNLNSEIPEKLEIRLEYGAKEDIIELLNIKYIGRVRARKLYNEGIRCVEDILKNPEKVVHIVGRKTAEKILKEILKEKENL